MSHLKLEKQVFKNKITSHKNRRYMHVKKYSLKYIK